LYLVNSANNVLENITYQDDYSEGGISGLIELFNSSNNILKNIREK